MARSILQGESTVDRGSNNPYTLIPVALEIDDDYEQSYDCEEFCGSPWRFLRTIVGLIALVIFCLLIPIVIQYNSSSNSQINPPRFFLDSLRVVTFNINQGELSATWNVNLTISNDVNSTLLNIINFNALLVYKEDKALAFSAPIESENLFTNGIFFVDKNETKTLTLTFNTTGWEKDQPVVDDDVIQEIDDDIRMGVLSFGLKMEAVAEIKINLMNDIVVMQPYCSNLDVDLTTSERGEVGAWDDVDEVKECLYPLDQWYTNNVGN
ncbi:hypothetical protein VNO78_21125 [Psophocarpus tetragonolobus]|uniref:Late embryogenesis abundant protein LEA-2 subgroup domain-containing protein n=1 Tax=Psophocarpus tetragonolobus TaxID=3891 RepID=A0AAN9SB68_PSOTE